MDGGNEFDELHKKISNTLIRRIKKADTPFLETYPGEVYTADNFVMYASLSVFNHVWKRKNTGIFVNLKKYTQDNLIDTVTGVILPNIYSSNSRGSWAGWSIFYINFFDKKWAKEQYKYTKENFIVKLPFSIYACREYSKGCDGSGDIDSGPVVMGLSTSGTGFILSSAHLYKDVEIYNGILKIAEIIGQSYSCENQRHYLLSPLVGDAIMLAMKTSCDWW